MRESIHIIGAGPGGLFTSLLLLEKGFEVHLYERNSGVGKKFLIAGKSGLNITNSKTEDFHQNYYKNGAFFKSLLDEFGAHDLISWMESLGVESFEGSSGKVFPESFKGGNLLSKWLSKLNHYDCFHLHLNHKLIDLDHEGNLSFDILSEEVKVKASKVVLALGGASWSHTGSDGDWMKILNKIGVESKSFRAMNCGFNINWSDFFKETVHGYPLKNIALKFEDKYLLNEIMITKYGLEGNGIYQFSKYLQDSLGSNKETMLQIDLRPQVSLENLIKIFNKRKKESLSSFLKKKLNLSREEILLFYETIDKNQVDSIHYLANHLKNIPIKVDSAQEIDKAISTSGGVLFGELSRSMELKKMKGVYIVGEMLDFEAPTGGYLLQGVFSTAYRVVSEISK